MKFKHRIIAALLMLSLAVTGCPDKVSAQTVTWPNPPDISSENAILIDADTGEILYEKNAYDKGFPASVTKIMTALLSIENCNLNDTVTFSYEAAHSYQPGDSNMGILKGEQLTVEQTLRGILMESANEACYGIAEYISGSEGAFVDLMNKRATELGANDTQFANTNGLHNNEHYTTCYDLAMIGRACFDNPTFMSICSEWRTFEIAPTNKYKSTRYLRNKYALLKNRKYEYEYSMGGKTGYTEEAGHTLISFAKKNGVRLICVVMRSTEETRYTDTVNLFEYGFNNFEKCAITNDTFNSYVSGTDNSYMPEDFFKTASKNLSINNSLYVLLPLGASKTDITASATFSENSFAEVTFFYNEHVLARQSIVVSSESEASDTNLPIVAKSDNNKIKATPFKTIKLSILLIIYAIIIIATVVTAYILIMNKTEYGQQKKLKRRRKRR